MKLSLNTGILFAFATTQVHGGEHGLRGLTDINLDPDCKVESFRLFEFQANGDARETSFSSNVLDMTDYYAGRINIAAQVTDGCQPGCVKLNFAGTYRTERVSPYFLYGDMPGGRVFQGSPRSSGMQELKACVYSDHDCTRGEQGCATRTLDVIPSNEPLEGGPFDISFKATFVGATGPASDEETEQASAAMCETINQYFTFGAFYREDVGVSDFQCSGSAVSADTLTIKFETASSVKKSTGFNPYTNSRLPDADLILTKITTLLVNNIGIGPGAPSTLDYFTNRLSSDNPYGSVTSISIA